MRSDDVRGGCFTRSCVNFTTHVAILVIAAVVGLVMAIVTGFGSTAFTFWISLFTFAIGGFVPNPTLRQDDDDVKPSDVTAPSKADN